MVGLGGIMTFAFFGAAFAAAAAARLVDLGTGVSNQLSGFRMEKKLPKSPPKVPPLPCFSSTVINSSKSMLFERSASASLNACSSCSSLMLRPERSAWGDLMSRRSSSRDIVPLPSVSAASKRGRSFPRSAAVDMASETARWTDTSLRAHTGRRRDACRFFSRNCFLQVLGGNRHVIVDKFGIRSRRVRTPLPALQFAGRRNICTIVCPWGGLF